MKYNLFIGRWAPFHEGHKYIIDSFVNNGKPVCIAIRETPMSLQDPFPAVLREKRIKEIYKDNDMVKVVRIPDIDTVCVGRGVGYSIMEVPQEIAKVSGTAKRQLKCDTWNEGKGKILWFTGLPCSGKTTIARQLEETIMDKDKVVLDGDIFRKIVTPHLSFSKKDRIENIIIAFNIAKILANHGLIVLCCFVSPIAYVRNQFKEQMGDKFKEIYVKCSEKICAKRDVKGMWKKAKDGEIKNFTGYNDPYEIPKEPDLIIDTENESVNESCHKVLDLLEE